MHEITPKEIPIKQPGIVIIDVWAPWCGPCRMLMRHLELLAPDYPKVRLYKINIDDYEDWGKEMGIKSIPTLLIYKDGMLIDKHTGQPSKDDLVRLLSMAS